MQKVFQSLTPLGGGRRSSKRSLLGLDGLQEGLPPAADDDGTARSQEPVGGSGGCREGGRFNNRGGLAHKSSGVCQTEQTADQHRFRFQVDTLANSMWAKTDTVGVHFAELVAWVR